MVLSVQSLTYHHPGKTTPVFADVSFNLAARQVLCLLGPNGVGKTTLLRCITGLTNASTGCVRIQGGITHSTRQQARHVAYVPQAASNHASALTALDMVVIGRTPYLSAFAMPTQQDRHIAHAMLRKVGVAHLQDAPFNRLSGGEQQLVVIARALAQAPVLLVMDEPAASLDLGNQALVLKLIRNLCQEGLSVLMTTHQPEHAWLLQAQVAILQNGKLTACGPADGVLNEASLTALYGCPVAISRIQGKPWACTPRELLA